MKNPLKYFPSYVVHHLFTIVILTYPFASTTDACFMAKWNIYVTSDISDNIIGHIKSGDDDLGNHTIPFRGNYNWSFCDKFFGGTLFYGYFWWGSKFQSLALFDDNLRDICAQAQTNQNCYWLVRYDGFYVSAYDKPFPDNNYHFIKPWG
ncbi:hypothetical protein L6452_30611 [Arctium lappa]|uniref:Uncharacterized protein n=1 Tax=Arctium lappa TaxID=4217 RepID=A0ACB8ZJT8_ARCLA|nr:hypothetical protein L6452_30611 [Arctium lappa]